MEKALNIIAAIIAIANGGVVLIQNFSVTGPKVVNNSFFDFFDFSEYQVTIKIIITIILEFSLASFFGYLICKVINLVNGAWAPSIVFTIIIGFLSAYISFFNIEVVLLGNPEFNGFWDFAGLFGLIAAAYTIGAIFIHLHFDEHVEIKRYHKGIDESLWPILLQALAFLLIFIGNVIDLQGRALE